MRTRRLLAVLLTFIAVFSLAHPPVSRWVRASRLLLALASPRPEAAALLETDLELPGRDGPIRARLYRCADRPRAPGLVVAHGVHWRGIDERRLVPFARELARAGRTVLTPELRDLTDYRITPLGERIIGDSVTWLAAHTGAPVGLLGFSFAGGLSLVAASRPELEGKLAYVTSVGGHHDLARVLRFLVSDRIETPAGEVTMKAHDYGLLVVTYGLLEHFVDPADQPTLRDALRLWLHEDRSAAIARASQRTTESGERLFRLVERGTLAELGPELLALLEVKRAELADLSPAGRLAHIEAPVYLLHGAADSVIPPSEAEWGDRELDGAPHQALVSPLLEHVEVEEQGGFRERLALVDLMARML